MKIQYLVFASLASFGLAKPITSFTISISVDEGAPKVSAPRNYLQKHLQKGDAHNDKLSGKPICMINLLL